ncbi:MAG: hypothetical protein AAB855_02335 [Patescibacteria group bacterium]
MSSQNQKQTLFWVLVLGIFLVVFLFWIPSFIRSIGTLVQSVGSQTSESTTELEGTITPQIEELKKSFDTLVKQIPTNASVPASQEFAQPSVFPDAKVTAPDDTTRQYCEQNGGIHQPRPGCTICDGKTPGQPYNVCIFLDGSECEQNMFKNGECKKGQTQTAEDLMRPSEAY